MQINNEHQTKCIHYPLHSKAKIKVNSHNLRTVQVGIRYINEIVDIHNFLN